MLSLENVIRLAILRLTYDCIILSIVSEEVVGVLFCSLREAIISLDFLIVSHNS